MAVWKRFTTPSENRTLYIIADLPDDATAAAVSMVIGNAGALDISVTVLVTPETIDEAIGKSVPYRPRELDTPVTPARAV